MAADKSLKDLAGGIALIAENSPKIQSDVEKIREAIYGKNGIFESILSMAQVAESLEKRNKENSVKNFILGDKTEKNNKKLLKNTSNINDILKDILKELKRQNKGGKGVKLDSSDFKNQGKKSSKAFENILQGIQVMSKLKEISLKSLIFAKKKIKSIKQVMFEARNIFKNFKNNKEAEQVISFTSSASDLIKKLGKVYIWTKFAKKSSKALEVIYLGVSGKGGLLGLFRNLSKHKKDIKNAKKYSKELLVVSGTMILTAIALAAVAAVGPVSILGALISAGIILILLGSFKLLGSNLGGMVKGALAFTLLSVGLIAFSVGFAMLRKATQKLSWEEALIMTGVVGISALIMGAAGLIAVPIALGSLAMILVAAAIGAMAFVIDYWSNVNAEKAMGNIETVVEGLKRIFGLDFGGDDSQKSFGSRVGDSLKDLCLTLLSAGKMFIMMGAILLAGVALGLLYYGVKQWDNFDGEKASKNIEKCITSLKKVFGLDDSPSDPISGTLKLGGDLLALGSALLQGGKVLIQMGVLVIATVLMDIIRVTLIPWNNYDGKKAAANMKTAIGALKECFGLENSDIDSVGGALGAIGGAVGDLLGMGSALIQGGKIFAQLGVIVMATGLMDVIRLGLIPWNDYDASTAVGNIDKAFSGLKKAYGFKDRDGEDLEGFVGQGIGIDSDIMALASSLLQAGKSFITMGTILMATAIMGEVYKNIKEWDNYDSTNSIKNIETTIKELKRVFGLEDSAAEEVDTKVEESSGLWGKVKNLAGKAADAVFDTASNLIDIGKGVTQMGATWATLGTLVEATGLMYTVLGSIKPWDEFNPENSITNISTALTSIGNLTRDTTLLINEDDLDLLEDLVSTFEDIMDDLEDATDDADEISEGLDLVYNSIIKWTKPVLKNSIILNRSVRFINSAFSAIDYRSFEKKADVMSDLFEDIADNKIYKEYSSDPITGSVNAVNSLDVQKATIMTEMFKSFAGIKDTDPFDIFNKAVDRFVDACNDMVDSVDNFNEPKPVQQVQQSKNIPTTSSGSMSISNTDQLAEAIASALRRLPLKVYGGDVDVNLVVDGSTGRSVTLTLKN